MDLNDEEEVKEITLSPEVRRIRNSIIKKFAHEPLEVMAKFVKDVVENEEDTVRRLGAMAARVEILRMRISQISDNSNEPNFDDVTEEVAEENVIEEEVNNIVVTSPNLSDWVRLRIIENSEINGVRFPKGVVIDVSQEDGDRLLESGKASYVEEDEIADVKSGLSLSKKTGVKTIQEKIGQDPDLDEKDILGSEELKPESSQLLENPEAISEEEPETEDLSSKQVTVEKPPKESKDKTKSNKIPDKGDDTSDSATNEEDMLAGFDLEAEDLRKK